MNAWDAIKSGLPFRHKDDNRPFIRGNDGWWYPNTGVLCGDGWEVQEPVATVTTTQFWAAAAKVLKIEHKGWKIECNTSDTLIASRLEDFARELGLGVKP